MLLRMAYICVFDMVGSGGQPNKLTLLRPFCHPNHRKKAVGKSIKRNNHSRQLNPRETTATADEFSSLSDKRRNVPPNKQPRLQVKQIGEVFRTNQFSINFTSFSQARFAAFELLE